MVWNASKPFAGVVSGVQRYRRSSTSSRRTRSATAPGFHGSCAAGGSGNRLTGGSRRSPAGSCFCDWSGRDIFDCRHGREKGVTIRGRGVG
ncbi:MAG: hypothetical protein V3R93_07905 [Candidatus Hydrothermarchaeaceae archaeon]